MSDIERKIRAIVVEQLNVKPDQVTGEAKLVEDLGADSLDVVELTMALEEVFEITIPDEQAEELVTVDDVRRYLQGAIAAS
ncbi:acyl carrier protein [Hydrocarboniclastica marina]|uniref:Acyl carrier protein n=1 Tax=Hydrocarboniclastica marina TaxID=2259620 RepID=A0A4V1D961_9ALTE|nr:acyl carrier protein [Hydrocarboniclastica marina]QCF27570.1 acyl carrier protein [Hydrocarboniclastica marina]